MYANMQNFHLSACTGGHAVTSLTGCCVAHPFQPGWWRNSGHMTSALQMQPPDNTSYTLSRTVKSMGSANEWMKPRWSHGTVVATASATKCAAGKTGLIWCSSSMVTATSAVATAGLTQLVGPLAADGQFTDGHSWGSTVRSLVCGGTAGQQQQGAQLGLQGPSCGCCCRVAS